MIVLRVLLTSCPFPPARAPTTMFASCYPQPYYLAPPHTLPLASHSHPSFPACVRWFSSVDMLRHFFLTALIGVIHVGGKGGASAFGHDDVQSRLVVAGVFCLGFIIFFLQFNVFVNARGRVLAIMTHVSMLWM